MTRYQTYCNTLLFVHPLTTDSCRLGGGLLLYSNEYGQWLTGDRFEGGNDLDGWSSGMTTAQQGSDSM